MRGTTLWALAWLCCIVFAGCSGYSTGGPLLEDCTVTGDCADNPDYEVGEDPDADVGAGSQGNSSAGGAAAGGASAATPAAGDGTGAGTSAGAGAGTATGGEATGGAAASGWLRVIDNRIYTEAGAVWAGRGANFHDTRSCNACAYSQPNVDEVKRRLDALIDDWGADFLRLDLESQASAGGRVGWQGVVDDADYLAELREIIDYIATKPGVYVLMSLWVDPSFTDDGLPTAATIPTWERLTEEFAFDSHVLFGIANEPEGNYNGNNDRAVWDAMNAVAEAIRATEERIGAPQHLISVQGTGGWGRFIEYYVDHPITAGGGTNIVYETHAYNSESDFQELFLGPGESIPVIIGEFAVGNQMTTADATALMEQCEAAGIPYLAWTFHMRCAPNLLVDNSGGGCGVGMRLEPTAWGTLLRNHLLAGRSAAGSGGGASSGASSAASSGSGAGSASGGSPTGTTAPATQPPATQPSADPVALPAGWLRVVGNRIYTSDGDLWAGRGANIHDTRSCNACAYSAPNVAEVNRRIDALVDDWGADFIRLNLESYASAGGRVSWRGVVDDADYLANIRAIIDHIAAKPGVYVLMSLWVDPSFTAMGWPTAATIPPWQRLAEEFAFDGRVLFGIANEPERNYGGDNDDDVWTAMNDVVEAIRDTEDRLGAPHHLISVQGTGGWGRFIEYYVDHPITAGGGDNIVYETHAYNREADFQDLFLTPGETIPVVIGEFAMGNQSSESDVLALMEQCEAAGIPYLAWTFHMRCAPNLLADTSGGGCGAGMPLQPTAWGEVFRSHLLSTP